MIICFYPNLIHRIKFKIDNFILIFTKKPVFFCYLYEGLSAIPVRITEITEKYSEK